MIQKFFIVIFLLLPFTGFANTGQAIVQAQIEDAQIVGQGRMTYMMWDVYDATLYAPNGVYKPNAPYALSLEYLRGLRGDKIAKKSIDEMRKNGAFDEVTLQLWLTELTTIFPDVQKGDVITGLRDDKQHTIFFVNGTEAGAISDPIFTQAFFDIWLGENTTAPDLQKQILGQG